MYRHNLVTKFEEFSFDKLNILHDKQEQKKYIKFIHENLEKYANHIWKKHMLPVYDTFRRHHDYRNKRKLLKIQYYRKKSLKSNKSKEIITPKEITHQSIDAVIMTQEDIPIPVIKIEPNSSSSDILASSFYPENLDLDSEELTTFNNLDFCNIPTSSQK